MGCQTDIYLHLWHKFQHVILAEKLADGGTGKGQRHNPIITNVMMEVLYLAMAENQCHDTCTHTVLTLYLKFIQNIHTVTCTIKQKHKVIIVTCTAL